VSDFNELNHESKIRVTQTISKSWELVSGLKGPAWGGFAFLALIAIGISIAIAIIMFIIGFAMFGSGHIDPNTMPQGGSVIIQGLNTTLSIISDFFVIPIAVGLSLIPVHRLKGEAITAYRVFEYFKWRFMWRFSVVLIVNYILIAALVFIAILILAPMAMMHGGEPTITPTLILVGSLLGIRFFFVLAYIGTALHFTNMLIGEKEMPLAHALGEGFKGVTKHFLGIVGVMFLAMLIILAFEAICFGIGFLFVMLNLKALGIFLAIAMFIFGIIWIFPFALNIWALLYSQIFGIETIAVENYENVASQRDDQY